MFFFRLAIPYLPGSTFLILIDIKPTPKARVGKEAVKGVGVYLEVPGVRDEDVHWKILHANN